MKDGKTTLKDKLMYGCGDIFGGGAFLLISLLFLNYLTDVELIAPALAGIIIMLGKIWDAISDPLMGIISDKTKSKFGRRRIYFLVGIIPVFISFSLLWYSFGISSKPGLFTYYFFMYMLFNTVFTLVMIPYNSILPEMTKDYKERTSFTGTRMIFSVSSAILAGVLPKIIVNSFGSNIKQGYFVMALIFGAIYAIPWLIVFLGTWENTNSEVQSTNSNIFNELVTVFRNRSFRVHAGIFLSGQAGVDFLTTLFIYYLTVCIKRPGEFSAVLGTLLVTQLISMPIHTKISKKQGKTAPLKFGLTVWAFALICSLFLSPSSSRLIIYIIAALSGFGASSAVLVPWSILPEVSDVDELITSKRREGIYSGMATFLRKMANGLTVGLIGVILQWIGYVKPEIAGQSVAQSSGTILGIKIMFGVVPIILIILNFFISGKYNMTEEKYNVLMSEIDRMKKGGSISNMPQKSREICQELTGIPYQKLWSGSSIKNSKSTSDIM